MTMMMLFVLLMLVIVLFAMHASPTSIPMQFPESEAETKQSSSLIHKLR